MDTTVQKLHKRSAVGGTKAPVFVVGCPRSGTSLLYHSLLSSGGFAFYDEETHFFSGLVPRVGNLANVKNRKELVAKWLESRYFKVDGLEMDDLQRRLVNDCSNSGDFLRIVMESIARSQNVDRWAEKTPDHVLYLDEIDRTIPDALIVHIIRDGRDVALSLDRAGFLNSYLLRKSDGLMVCGLYWEWLIDIGTRLAEKLGSRYMEVRFENLVHKRRETLRKVGRFIGHDLHHDRIQQAGIRTVSKPNTSFKVGKDVPFNPVNRWTNDFPTGELAKFEALLGPSLRKLGYEPASQPQIPSVELRSLRAYYRWYFSTRLWMKTHRVPLARRFVRDRVA